MKTCFSCCQHVYGITVYLVVPLLCLLSVGNSFKTCIISVGLGRALQRFSLFNRYIPILNRVAKSIEELLRYHKISFHTCTLNTLVTRKHSFSRKKLFPWVTGPDLSVVPLSALDIQNVRHCTAFSLLKVLVLQPWRLM